jgi:NTE family protein
MNLKSSVCFDEMGSAIEISQNKQSTKQEVQVADWAGVRIVFHRGNHMTSSIGLLKKVPLFQSFNRQELERLSCLFKQVSFAKGEKVCCEGEAGDCFYIIEFGELEVITGEKSPKVINRMGPGEFFGEIALLEGGQRTATIQCARDTRLLILKRDDFDTYFLKNAKALLYLSKLLSKRLVNVTRQQVMPKTVNVVAVLGSTELKGKTTTALALGFLINQFSVKKALYVEFVSSKDKDCKEAFTVDSVLKQTAANIYKWIMAGKNLTPRLTIKYDNSDGKKIRARLSRLIETLKDNFPYLIFDVQAEENILKSIVSEKADYHVNVINQLPEATDCPLETGSTVSLPVINQFNDGSPALPVNHMSPFILPVEPDLTNADKSDLLKYLQQNPSAPFCRPLARLARKILGITIGLALGGGAAFGMAHIGVIQTLEENGIPIDLIAGTSMGSIIAVLYSAGNSGKQLAEIASKFNIKRQLFAACLDISLLKPGGFLTGRRIKTMFNPILKKTFFFKDLMIPCRTVATDIETSERIAIKDGRLDFAYKASSSVPMIWCPENHQGRLLVNGAISDPVPAEVIREMGADICIAINVVPPVHKEVDSMLTAVSRKIHRLNPLMLLSRSSKALSMFSVIMNAIQTLQYELGNFKAISADVLINPDLSEFTWIEFYRSAELIEKGRQAAVDVLPEIREVISRRLSESDDKGNIFPHKR